MQTFVWQTPKRAYHVSRPVSEASSLFILASKNETAQFCFVNPVNSANDLQRGKNPPGIADIRQLRGNNIITVVFELS